MLVLFPADAQDIEIKGAQVILEPKTVSVELVTIENRRNSPLMAWEVGLSASPSGAPGLITKSDFTWQRVHPSSASGPIKPNEKRVLEIGLDDRDLGSPKVILAVFDDGYVEGQPEAVGRWQKQHQERADDAAYWVRAFEGMPTSSEEAARQYLAERMAQRASEEPRESSGIRGQLTRIWYESPQPRGWLFSVVERIRKEALRQHAALTQRPATLPRPEGAATVVLSSERAVRTEFVASVRNLRQVPIEAVGIEELDAETNRVRSGQGSDFCPADPAARGSNHIFPGESREYRVGGRGRDASRLPVVRISFVMFDDLVFEGSYERRETLLRERERRADNIAFALAVRAEAATKPAEEALAFLEAKRAERVRQLAARRNEPDVRLLDDLIKEARTSPEALRTNIAAATELERQRQRLQRHATR